METSQLICCANQLTGFYVRATLAFNGLKKSFRHRCFPVNFAKLLNTSLPRRLLLKEKFLWCKCDLILVLGKIFEEKVLLQLWFDIIAFKPLYLASKIGKPDKHTFINRQTRQTHFYNLKEITIIIIIITIIHHKLSKNFL